MTTTNCSYLGTVRFRALGCETSPKAISSCGCIYTEERPQYFYFSKKGEKMSKKKKQNGKSVSRDYNILLIAKREINCRPKVVKSKKIYSRKTKHKTPYLKNQSSLNKGFSVA